MRGPYVVDTDVAIDYLRGHPQAGAFFRGIGPFLMSVVTVAELDGGVREGRERVVLEGFLKGVTVVPLDLVIAIRGGLIRRDYRKSHGVGLSDALVAATAETLSATVVTLNRKHFPATSLLLVPYTKP